MNTNDFSIRHIGPGEEEVKDMLKYVGANSIDELIAETIPSQIRLNNPLKLGPAMSEHEFLQHINRLGNKNKVFKSYIGLGYHPTKLPPVIQRNILENPGWYTAYTP
ncbi:MAG: glycine dehydrogenase (aminomethyl-transferring), partial [Bacteroidia bacterium]|nr:glycine dehydrogenase (aminomethyl-transferring) [Bacteroidia bacterium]